MATHSFHHRHPRTLGPTFPLLELDPGGGGDMGTAIYRAIMQAMPEGAIVCSLDGEVLDANEQAASLLELDPAILEGLPLPTALEEAGCRPEKRPFDHIREAAPGDHPLHLGPYDLKAGLTLRLHTFSINGQALVLALLQEPEAGESGALPRGTLEVFSEGALRVDREGTVLEANGAALRLLERTREQVEEKELAALVPAINPPGLADRVVRHSLASGSWTGVLKLQRRDEVQEIGLAARRIGDGEVLVSLRDMGRRASEGAAPGFDPAPLVEAVAQAWLEGPGVPDEGQADDVPAEALTEVLRRAARSLDYDLACFETYHAGRGEFEITHVDARGEAEISTGVLLPESGSSSGRVKESGDVLVLANLQEERRWDDLRLFRGMRSGLKVPVGNDEVFQGVLGLWSEEEGFFDDSHRGPATLLGLLVEDRLLQDRLRGLRGRTEEQERLARLHGAALERIGEGVVSLDLEGTVLWANRAAQRLTGRDRDELMGTRVPTLLEEGGEELEERIGAGSWKGRLRLDLGDGASRRVEAQLSGSEADFRRGAPLLLTLRDVSGEEESSLRIQRLTRQVETARKLMAVDDEAPDLGAWLARFATALGHQAAFDEAQVWVASEEDEALILHAAARGGKARVHEDLYFSREETLLGEASSRVEAAFYPRLTDESTPDAVRFQEEGFRSLAVLPLVDEESEAAADPGELLPLLVLLSVEEDAFSTEIVHDVSVLLPPLAEALERLGPAGAVGGAS